MARAEEIKRDIQRLKKELAEHDSKVNDQDDRRDELVRIIVNLRSDLKEQLKNELREVEEEEAREPQGPGRSNRRGRAEPNQ